MANMPWHIESDDPSCPASKPWGVHKDDDGELEGCHETKEKAGRQIAALNAAENAILRLFGRGFDGPS